jgi:uridine kinase
VLTGHGQFSGAPDGPVPPRALDAPSVPMVARGVASTSRRRRPIPTPRRIISLYGPTGSGKSSLAVQLVERLGPDWSTRVPADWYLLTDGDQRAGESGYAWDWPRLLADLAGLDGREIQTPAFDFTTMRRSETGSAKTFTLRPLMIVDAMRPFPGADLLIRLDVPAPIRRERLAERDARWGTSVLDRWTRLEAGKEPAGIVRSDLALDGRAPLRESVSLIAGEIGRRFGDPPVREGDGHRLFDIP